MALTEDFSVYTDTDQHGTSATVDRTPVDGFFDHEYVEVEVNGIPVAGYKPVFGCSVADLPHGFGHGSWVMIDNTHYEIVNWKKDGTGWIDIILEEQ